jgi:hypothetical protein
MKKYYILKKITLFTVLISTLLVSCYPEQSLDYNPELKTFPDITLTSFSPTSGYPGTSITITGTNFGEVKQAAKISFSDASVNIDTEIVSYTDTEIVVLVPEYAGTGQIDLSVWTNNVLSSSDFTYLPGVEINSLSKDRAIAGEQITIIGNNFGTEASAISVLFNGGVEATIDNITNKEILVTVPDGGDSGTISILYDNGNRETVGPTFVYLNPSIVFDSFLETTPEFGGSFDRTGSQASGYWPSSKPTNYIGDREWVIHCNDQSGRNWGFVNEGSGILKIGNQRTFGYDISSDATSGYTKPTLLTLESNFNISRYVNNSPPRVGRGFVLGFMPEILPSTTHGSAVKAFHGLYGIVLTPDSDEILLYNGTAKNWNGQIETVPTPTGYDGAADHHLKLVVDTTTGQMVSLELDGTAINFTSTINFFTDVNTKYMAIGGNTMGASTTMDCYDVSFY